MSDNLYEIFDNISGVTNGRYHRIGEQPYFITTEYVMESEKLKVCDIYPWDENAVKIYEAMGSALKPIVAENLFYTIDDKEKLLHALSEENVYKDGAIKEVRITPNTIFENVIEVLPEDSSEWKAIANTLCLEISSRFAPVQEAYEQYKQDVESYPVYETDDEGDQVLVGEIVKIPTQRSENRASQKKEQ